MLIRLSFPLKFHMKDERKWEARDSGTDKKSNKEWDSWSSHSWLTSSISTDTDKLGTRNRWKCAPVRSVSHQTPTICYHGKLSVRAVSHGRQKHHSTVKCWGEEIPISLFVVIFNSTLSNLTQKHSSSQLRQVLPNLSFNLDEGFVIVEVTIAIVTTRLAAWKME